MLLHKKRIPPLEMPSWLEAQTLFPKFYFKCKRTGMETVALGSLIEINHIPTPSNLSECYYGILPFPSSSHAPFFFLPQVEIKQKDGQAYLLMRDDQSRALLKASRPLAPAAPLYEREDFLPKQEWIDYVYRILQGIEQKKLQKVVAARKTIFQTRQTSLFCWLQKLLMQSSNTTLFALQKEPSSLFLGSTPEVLYHRQGDAFYTEAIAGTRAKGDPAKPLQNSAKDLEEVRFVKDFLQEKLATLCQTLTPLPENSLLQTDRLQHLHAPFVGTLLGAMSDQQLLQALHPTPAVGGTPSSVSLECIARHEGFDRGFYAGSIGFISPSESSLAVAIRSSFVTRHSLTAFAGAGIVQDSDPEQEWEELNLKISHWMVP